MIQVHQLILLLSLATSAAAYIAVVTGANGFVGRHVVYSMLQKHFGEEDQAGDGSPEVIVCLVRAHKLPYEESYWNAHMMDLQRSSSEKSVCLKVLPYDMLDSGESLNDALEAAINVSTPSCRLCVYHIASTFGPTPDPIQTAKENVQSAEDVVCTLDRFYRRYPLTKPRLILTSSMAAVRATDQTPLNGKYYTHRDWNTLSVLNSENWGQCYQWSKGESERRAWELVKECNEKYANEDGSDVRRLEMIALCPSFVFGPSPPMPSKLKVATNSHESSSYSLTLINQWLHGKSPVQSRLCADVRDVAKAHVAAGTLDTLPIDDVDRRYILSTEERLSSELTAQSLIRGVKLAQKDSVGGINIDTSKITCDNQFTGGAIKIGEREVDGAARLERDLGIICRPVQETMQDMAAALISSK
ncbi:hypothetical protein ACHAWF_004680 [Thalassiosira exigua]